MGKYDDIINTKYEGVPNRFHMSNRQRAAQFAPFAALSGYGDMIKESTKIKDEKVELSEDELNELNQCFSVLKKGDIVKIVYYDRGYYRELEGKVTRIDIYERNVRVDDIMIRFMNIRSLELIEVFNG